MRHARPHTANNMRADQTPESALKSPDHSIPFEQRLTCTIAEACVATGLGRTKLYELIGDASIKTRTIGRRRLVSVPSLRSFFEPKED